MNAVSTRNAKVMTMTTLSQRSLKPVLAIIAVLSLAGCAVEVQNTQAAHELKHQAQPPGSVYGGWRVFQDKCAHCHGPAATGMAGSPGLIPRRRDMGRRQFVGRVL